MDNMVTDSIWLSDLPAYTATLLLRPFLAFTSAVDRVHWLYLLGAFLIAYIAYLAYKRKYPATRSFFAFAFPKDVYAHPSAINDYKFFYLNNILLVALLTPMLVVVAPFASDWAGGLVPAGWAGVMGKNSVAASIVFTLIMALAADLALYVQHYAFHKVPWLWEFHKVHHSAEVLTPFTVYRMHPLDILTAAGLLALFTGVADGVVQQLFVGQVGLINLLGLNIVFVLFYLFGYNLRHSHVWVDYGPVMSHVLVSPAQHQIHHSEDKAHWDKNLGFIFAIWDWAAGTLYVPKTHEKITFGLGDRGENRKFGSVMALYFQPLLAIMKLEGFRLPRPSNVVLFFSFILLMAACMVGNAQKPVPAAVAGGVARPVSESLHLEELTWTQVRDKINSGYTTVIIPTGGTEQNGPHMVLGKHNYVVRHTAEKVARRLGETLVAPVVRYVPEGNIDPPEGHMRFAGTISIPEETFAGVLEYAARSLKQHGFNTICFLGDSGGSQAVQRRVAERLNAEWAGDGVRVIHVNEYYDSNGQFTWLLNRGFSPEQIGTHAGMRDTSELMSVFPQGVLSGAMRDKDAPGVKGEKTGVRGNPRLADPEKGRNMLQLKVEAAEQQIRRHLDDSNNTATRR